ncbi:hypothetical protein [Iningainema tapete]|uniref:Uncharacterized protein n=1 Tax=Iningainema tapete BLCC-T55 TaxID=2748662 RepID=A0A8J6XZU5_9CYAN|nr:hypothetical protein [Iningainema tapete]MBD2776353.1 hypothetical protein [Iningainema tapete BLCC-T55]
MDNFSEIQSGGQGNSSGKFAPIQLGKDFFDNLGRCRDDGEKIQLFLETAQRADVPLRAIEELLNYQDQFILAMGLQSFGYITNPQIKAQLANLQHIEELDEPLEEIYLLPNPAEYKQHSIRILEKLCQEAKSGRDLTRLSAAWAMQRLGYSPMISGKFLPKSAQDIQSQIISQNLNRLNDRSIFNDPSRYKEYIDFWVYAPKVHLFQLLQTIPSSYVNVVESILVRLGVVGVEFVNRSASTLQKFVVEAGLRLADFFLRDRKYQDNDTQRRLSDILISFLDNSDIDLRRLAAKPINEICSWLNTTIRAKAAVISRDWNKVEELGEASVPFLIKAVQGSLRLDTQDNLREQVEAVRCISIIYATSVNKQISTLSEFLQHYEQTVREATVSCLKQHKNQLDLYSKNIFTALDFKFELEGTLESLNLNSMSFYEICEKIRGIEEKIKAKRRYQAVTQEIFEVAISSCQAEATEVKAFFSYNLERYSRMILDSIQQLDNQKESLQKRKAEEERRRHEKEAEEKRKQTITTIKIVLLSLITVVAVTWGGIKFVNIFFRCFIASLIAGFVIEDKGLLGDLIGCGCLVWLFVFGASCIIITSLFGPLHLTNTTPEQVGFWSGLIIGTIAGIAVCEKFCSRN